MAIFQISGNTQSLIDALNNDARLAEIETIVKRSTCDFIPSYPWFDVWGRSRTAWHKSTTVIVVKWYLGASVKTCDVKGRI